jgi:selenocysteine lyase/cysteine desulfurase
VHLIPAVEGMLHLDPFKVAYAPKAATIAISHVQFSNGCRQDLHDFGQLKEHRSLVVCASQSLGALPVDVRSARIDALACSGHKWLCAGYGAGFVYLRRELLARKPPKAIGWLSVRDPYAFDNARYSLLQGAARHETGCPPFAGIFALGAAIEYLVGLGLDRIAQRVLELNDYLTDALERADFTVLSPGGPHRSGLTLVELPEPREAAGFLKQRGILVTEKPEGIRISTHFYNIERDVDVCVEALKEYRGGAS